MIFHAGSQAIMEALFGVLTGEAAFPTWCTATALRSLKGVGVQTQALLASHASLLYLHSEPQYTSFECLLIGA